MSAFPRSAQPSNVAGMDRRAHESAQVLVLRCVLICMLSSVLVMVMPHSVSVVALIICSTLLVLALAVIFINRRRDDTDE